ncbi:MAG: UDP-N-acetylmuramoyl-L-alanyl-D-glutamate--2,6-diaminopimelate ligase [Nocardioides sp.]|uniref:UDP-N-acetylmuramoyl-L-alanyl-D-glutamate--2, 6-diaminopimelate ligase n=1 Tax=Nocardioides sp. TaxID=35761 RepID=UPI003F0B05D4
MVALSARPRTTVPVPLDTLAAGISAVTEVQRRGTGPVEVTGVTLSTDRVSPGDLYAALPGARAHGADFAAKALAAGAVAVLTDPAGLDRLADDVPALVVASPRAVLGSVAAQVYDHPATAMRMIGVTGTQGKTTTTRMLDDALGAAGVPSAVIGTVGTRVLGQDVPTKLTTPEAPDLHGLFAMMREEGVQACAMEVSSHALALGRVDAVRFDVATFLNLGRDHLDFHADVDEYFAVKASLFTPGRSVRGLTNLDDEHGRLLLDVAGVPMSTYSLIDAGADWTAHDVRLGTLGSAFVARGPEGQEWPVNVSVPGEFNVSNALAALASAAMAGLDGAAVAAGFAHGHGVPGRLERVPGDQPFTVVVDYAHKPDALEAVLTTLRPVTEGRLVVVIGAGGDRDTGKRPLMGEISARLGDVVVVTDDNPRTEEAGAIRAAVLEGARGHGAEVLEVGDRREAIRTALGLARAGDVVLLAGKGHETGQEVQGVVHPFDDRTVAAEELDRL